MVHEETSFFGDEQLRARIAWYYFIAGLTQQEISDRLGIARARVNKIVGQLRAHPRAAGLQRMRRGQTGKAGTPQYTPPPRQAPPRATGRAGRPPTR